jgi:hypothetical protein
VSPSLIPLSLSGGYVLIALGHIVELWQVSRVRPGTPALPAILTVAAYLIVAAGLGLFAHRVDRVSIAAGARTALRVLAAGAGLLGIGVLCVAISQAQHQLPFPLTAGSLLVAVGTLTIGLGWYIWSDLALGLPVRRRPGADSSWPLRRRTTQIATGGAYGLYAIADLVAISAAHGRLAPLAVIGELVHGGGNAVVAGGHLLLVAQLPWRATAAAAAPALVILGAGGLCLGLAPVIGGGPLTTAGHLSVIAGLASGLGWLTWAAASMTRPATASRTA